MRVGSSPTEVERKKPLPEPILVFYGSGRGCTKVSTRLGFFTMIFLI